MGRERGERETMGTSSRKAYATFDELRVVEKRNDELRVVEKRNDELCMVEKRNDECPRADDSSAARENEERE